jgi:hypothetical protein
MTGAELRAMGVRFTMDSIAPRVRVPPEARAAFDAELARRIGIILAAAPSIGSISLVEIAPRPEIVPRAGLCVTCYEPHLKNYMSGMCELCICALRGAVRQRQKAG